MNPKSKSRPKTKLSTKLKRAFSAEGRTALKRGVVKHHLAIIASLLVISYVGGAAYMVNTNMAKNNSSLSDVFTLPSKNSEYAGRHAANNNPNPVIDYKKLSKLTDNYLHIDSYQVKDKKQMYSDSLLERYSYFKNGNSNFINSYVGSHGVISDSDPITNVQTQGVFSRDQYATRVALSTNYKFSQWNRELNPVIDYANYLRSYSVYNKQFATSSHAIINSLTPTDTNVNNDGNDDSETLYFSKNFAPSESRSLDYFSESPAATDWAFGIDDKLKQKASSQNENLMYAHGSIGSDDGDPHDDTYFFDGTEMSMPSLPSDSTTAFWGKQLRAKKLYKHVGNTVYSNGNAYFLQQMYQNYKNMCAGQEADYKKLGDDYKMIDVYKKGWHVSPVMFNDFVRQPNKYGSPYQFNYVVDGKPVWQVYDPESHDMLNYIEKQNYNLPANYDTKHYYYRTIEGTLVRDDNIETVNGNVQPLIMGRPDSSRPMPKNSSDSSYYNTQQEYSYASKYGFFAGDASQRLNYLRNDSGLEPLWMVGINNNAQIGTVHPGEIIRFDDKLTPKHVSKYYVVENGHKLYIPTYKVSGYDCFKVKMSFKGEVAHYVRAQDAYMLCGNKVVRD